PAIPRPGAVNEPLADLIDELEQGDATANNELRGNVRGSTPRMRPTSQRFRPSNTSAGRLTGRRPQAATTPPPSRSRRSATEVEPEPEADAEKWHRRDSGREIAVDDSQLVDWQTDTVSGGATAITSDDDFSDLGRKR